MGNAEMADTINRFMVPDFVVLTEESRILEVPSASFEEFDVAKRKVRACLLFVYVLAFCMIGHLDTYTQFITCYFS
jgi:hypothetical protein